MPHLKVRGLVRLDPTTERRRNRVIRPAVLPRDLEGEEKRAAAFRRRHNNERRCNERRFWGVSGVFLHLEQRPRPYRPTVRRLRGLGSAEAVPVVHLRQDMPAASVCLTTHLSPSLFETPAKTVRGVGAADRQQIGSRTAAGRQENGSILVDTALPDLRAARHVAADQVPTLPADEAGVVGGFHRALARRKERHCLRREVRQWKRKRKTVPHLQRLGLGLPGQDLALGQTVKVPELVAVVERLLPCGSPGHSNSACKLIQSTQAGILIWGVRGSAPM